MSGRTLSKGEGFVVGEGRNVRFWLDDWIVVGPLCGVFHRVCRVVSNKESYVSDYNEETDGCILWRVRSPHPSEEVLYEKL